MAEFASNQLPQLLAGLRGLLAQVQSPAPGEVQEVIDEGVTDLVQLGLAEAPARELCTRVVTKMAEFAQACEQTYRLSEELRLVMVETEQAFNREGSNGDQER